MRLFRGEKTMKNWIISKLRNYLAEDELTELYTIKQRIEEVKVWCSRDKKAGAICRYLQDQHDYPYQCKGAYGSIEDFRWYLESLDKKSPPKSKVKEAIDTVERDLSVIVTN